MPPVSDLLLLALATWRISSLFVHEKGPGNIFERLRQWVGIEHLRLGDSPEYYKVVPDTFEAQLLDCVWCFSMWCGTGWVILYYLFPTATLWLALPCALSALAIGVQRLIGSDE